MATGSPAQQALPTTLPVEGSQHLLTLTQKPLPERSTMLDCAYPHKPAFLGDVSMASFPFMILHPVPTWPPISSRFMPFSLFPPSRRCARYTGGLMRQADVTRQNTPLPRLRQSPGAQRLGDPWRPRSLPRLCAPPHPPRHFPATTSCQVATPGHRSSSGGNPRPPGITVDSPLWSVRIRSFKECASASLAGPGRRTRGKRNTQAR